MLVRKAKSLPVECIVRGYLSGSGSRNIDDRCDLRDQAAFRLTKRRVCRNRSLPSQRRRWRTRREYRFQTVVKSWGRMSRKSSEPHPRDLPARVRARRAEGIIIADTKLSSACMTTGSFLSMRSDTRFSRFWPRKDTLLGLQKSFDNSSCGLLFRSRGTRNRLRRNCQMTSCSNK